ncbi:MAG: hypothetical protein U0228_34390 [Myxococcaceae bacterium]
MDRVDHELARPSPLSPDAKAKMWAALQAELPSAPKKGRWQRELMVVLLAAIGLVLSLAIVLLVTGNAAMSVIASRAALIALCLAICGAASWVAIAPGARRWQLLAGVGFLLGAIVLVVFRREAEAASTPEWVCAATHFAVNLVPLAAGLIALRRAGLRLAAAVALGVSAGATGAMVGELACGRDSTHVLLFHVSAWASTIVAGALLSRIIKPRSHAP